MLYDDRALDAAWDLVKGWTAERRDALRSGVAKNGLRGDMQEIARQTVMIAEEGLRRRACLNSGGEDETRFLKPLFRAVETGQTPADYLLEKYRTDWKEDITRLFLNCSY